MNFHKPKFYLALSRLPLLRRSYLLKVMGITFLGFLIPLFTIIVYLTLNSSLNSNDKFDLLVVVLLATSIGTIITFFLLYLLFYPIILTSIALYYYLNEEQKLQLPTGFEDTVGQIMTYVQYMIEKLDLLNHSIKTSLAIDPLTGILNHRTGEERLRQDIARARRGNNLMLVALLDIDKFKEINTQFGHHLGDVCLTQIVEGLSKNIREGDWLARWNGDEFLMILWNFNHVNPTVVLERIQQQSVKIPMGQILQLSLSIGACKYKGNTDLDINTDLETLLIRLDDALYQAQFTQGGIVLM